MAPLPSGQQARGIQKTGAVAHRQQALGPFRVARVGEHLVAANEAKGEGRRAAEVLDGVRCHRHPVDLDRLAGDDLANLGVELPLDLRGAGEEDFHRLDEALAKARRADERERRRPPAVELRVQNEEGEAAEMIAVEMRDEDGADAVGIDAEPPHRDHARGAALDQERAGGRLDEKAGVEPSAAAEGVAAPEELKSHQRFHPTLGRAWVALFTGLGLTSSTMATEITPWIRTALAAPGKLRDDL